MLTNVEQILTADTETCVLAYTDILINPDRRPKTRSAWPILRVKIAHRKKWP